MVPVRVKVPFLEPTSKTELCTAPTVGVDTIKRDSTTTAPTIEVENPRATKNLEKRTTEKPPNATFVEYRDILLLNAVGGSWMKGKNNQIKTKDPDKMTMTAAQLTQHSLWWRRSAKKHPTPRPYFWTLAPLDI